MHAFRKSVGAPLFKSTCVLLRTFCKACKVQITHNSTRCVCLVYRSRVRVRHDGLFTFTEFVKLRASAPRADEVVDKERTGLEETATASERGELLEDMMRTSRHPFIFQPSTAPSLRISQKTLGAASHDAS
jgi:hypothetical protein